MIQRAVILLFLLAGCAAGAPPGSPLPKEVPACFTDGVPPSAKNTAWITDQAVLLPVGYIVLVRRPAYPPVLAAFRAEEQEVVGRGQYQKPFVRYSWWYQPDGDRTFRNAQTRTGYGESEELYPTAGPFIAVGQFLIAWSTGGTGRAWYYYHLPWTNVSSIYEFGLTCAVDVRKVDYGAVVWVRKPAPRQ
jgi:hypothetical protein